jgi:hypothetical protein
LFFFWLATADIEAMRQDFFFLFKRCPVNHALVSHNMVAGSFALLGLFDELVLHFLYAGYFGVVEVFYSFLLPTFLNVCVHNNANNNEYKKVSPFQYLLSFWGLLGIVWAISYDNQYLEAKILLVAQAIRPPLEENRGQTTVS